MKLRIFILTALSAVAVTAFGASSASATSMEVGGVKKTEAITYTFYLKLSFSMVIKDTSGAFANTCTKAHIHGDLSFPSISGTVTSLTYEDCTHKPVVTHKKGTIAIENIAGTTNGTVRSNGMELTVPATLLGFVITVNCKTENTDMGALTGVSSGEATFDVNAVLNCGSSLPSAKMEGTLSASSPAGLGVTS